MGKEHIYFEFMNSAYGNVVANRRLYADFLWCICRPLPRLIGNIRLSKVRLHVYTDVFLSDILTGPAHEGHADVSHFYAIQSPDNRLRW